MYKCLKLKLEVFLAGHIVAMVIYCATKLTATCSLIIEQLADTMILASTGIDISAGKLTKLEQHDVSTTSCHHCQMN